MPFLTTEEAQDRITQSAQTFNAPVANLVALKNVALSSGRKNIPDLAKITIGALTRIDGKSEVAKTFGVSTATALAFSQGKTALQSSAPSPELLNQVNETSEIYRNRISQLANSRVFKAISNISDEKLDEVKDVTKLASVANLLSKVTGNLAGEGSGTKIQFNIFRPRTKEESEYEVIEVQE